MRIGIIAGEASGDLLGAALIEEIKARHPDAEFEGIAGPSMAKAGCRVIYPSEKLAVMGLFEVLAHYRELRKIQKQIIHHFIANPPDVFIGIDAPDFNLTVERCLKESGIKAVHYVSPSVWAWRQYRIKKIARSVDLMLTLFPFEADFYRQHHVPVEFVGHPLADMIPLDVDRMEKRKAFSLSAKDRVVALLPGSRMSEVDKLSDLMIQAARLITEKQAGVRFVAPLATAATRKRFEKAYSEYGEAVDLTVIDGKSREAMAVADVVLLASGTAALEAMLLKRPMVVTYKQSSITHLLVKHLIKTPFVSLPNILAGKEVARELLQSQATPENLAREVNRLLEDEQAAASVSGLFNDIHLQLKQGASRRAVDAILNLIAESSASQAVAQ